MGKNILEFCLSPDLGGLELCAVDFFKNFTKKTNTYICVAEGKKLDNYLEDDTNKFHLTRNKFFPIIPALKLARIIDENDIDIIHFHWTRDIATVVLAKIMSSRKPKVVQSRHMTMTRFKDDFYHKWLYKNVYLIHAVTDQVKEQLEKFIPKDVRPVCKRVYLGVDEPKVDEHKIVELKNKCNISDEFVIGIFGRIEEGKGQYLLIEALAKLQNKNIKLLIVGHTMDDDYLRELRQRVNDLGLDERIIFVGFTKNMAEYLNLCDVTVLATKKETFGLVVLESMVNHVPVIATNAGGPLEIIDDEVDGLFFDRSVDDLVQKIEYLASNEDIKNSFSQKAYEKIHKKFNKEVQMQKMYEVINES